MKKLTGLKSHIARYKKSQKRKHWTRTAEATFEPAAGGYLVSLEGPNAVDNAGCAYSTSVHHNRLGAFHDAVEFCDGKRIKIVKFLKV